MNRIFVYGSLKKGFGNHRLLETARFLGETQVKGKMYSLGGYPGAKMDEEGTIFGELYEVDDSTKSRLDRLEGHPTFYKRIQVPCSLGVLVETYHYCGRVDSKPLVESGVWK